MHKSFEGYLYLTLFDTDLEIWRHELYYDFDYSMATSSFHFFESDNQWVGIAFDNDKEAANFYKTVVKESVHLALLKDRMTKQSSREEDVHFTPAAKYEVTPQLPRKQVMYPSKCADILEESDRQDSMSMRSSESSISGNSKKKDKKGLLSLFKRDGRKKKEGLSIEDVSGPMDFKHLAHIGFNPVTRRFDVNNIPPEWQSMFNKAGVSKKDLEDPQTANFIAGFVAEQQNNQQEAPPPLPKKKAIDKDIVPNAPPAAPLCPPVTSNVPPRAPPAPAQPSLGVEATNHNDQPPANDSRTQLMASIRGAGLGVLKPAPKVEKRNTPESSTTSASKPGGDMASMLAAALAQRKKQ